MSIAVYAAAGAWWSTEQGSVRLISATNAVENSMDFHFGIHFRMKPGWKIYWRSPGDAGYPPQMDWAGSTNLAKVNTNWPVPIRFSVVGLETLGYKNEVVIPLNIIPLVPNKKIIAKAKINYLTCNKICIPYSAKVSLDLPLGPETSSFEGRLISKFRSLVPKKIIGKNTLNTSVSIDGSPGDQILRVKSTILGLPDLLVEGPSEFRFGKAKLIERDKSGKAIFKIRVSLTDKSRELGTVHDLSGKEITLTLLGDINGAVEQKLRLNRNVLDQKPQDDPYWSIFRIVALAVLGGLILNLMPCVLPVLSLKLFSVIRYSDDEAPAIRRGFLASAAGIIFSFFLLGSGVLALKALGKTVGWGFQFQQPIFLGGMLVLITLFAANLWGYFEIRLPSFLFHSKTGEVQKQSFAGHFITGAFATLLATPCSAPFLGTAVGFALARGPFEIYLIFLFLGLGLALPYLVVAMWPRLASFCPKPGHWMIIFRKILALALIATLFWLISILDTQLGFQAAFFTASLLIILIVLIAFHNNVSVELRKAIKCFAFVLAFLVIINPLSFGEKIKNSQSIVSSNWQIFKPSNIIGHVARGKSVFVDVTADWCLTCKANKVLVLDSNQIRRYLNRNEVVAMRADWTNADPIISSFLQRFLRYGIPFNIVFGPEAPQGIILPELLSKSSVLSALKKAKGD